MDKINFLLKENFPLSSDTMEKMQQAYRLVANLALTGGDRYILAGCVDDGAGNVGDGIVVIDGEPLVFAGGAKKPKVTIQQTNTTLSAFGVDYPEAYVSRTAKFADAGDWDWADFARIVTNKELKQRISNAAEPPGTVKMWAGLINKIPAGYHLCNGSWFAIEDYPALYEAIGDTYSYNKGALYPEHGYFEIPDLRTCFVGGWAESVPSYNTMGHYGRYVPLTAPDGSMQNPHTAAYFVMAFIIRTSFN